MHNNTHIRGVPIRDETISEQLAAADACEPVRRALLNQSVTPVAGYNYSIAANFDVTAIIHGLARHAEEGYFERGFSRAEANALAAAYARSLLKGVR